MKKLRDSQKNMYPHSEVKIDLLQKYLEIYLNVLSNTFVRKIYLYDLFCGFGVYENEGMGSPLIMLQEINKVLVAEKGNKIDYQCFFNDYNQENIAKLRKNIAKKIFNFSVDNVKYSCEDYRSLISEVILEINSFSSHEKAFVFIDPYQYKGIGFGDIKSLLQSKKAEVLLFLPTQFMFRFESNGTPESLKCFIEELVPYEEWPKSATGIDFIENLKSHFKIKLGEDYYVDTFVIKRDEGQYYCLFFFTSHIFGFQKMLEAKWDIDKNEGRGWCFTHSSDLFAGQKSSVTLKFEMELKRYLLSGLRTNKDVYEFTLHNGHLPKHANEVLRNWQNEGMLTVLKKDGEMAIKGSYYLNYQDWRKNPDKVTFQLNCK